MVDLDMRWQSLFMPLSVNIHIFCCRNIVWLLISALKPHWFSLLMNITFNTFKKLIPQIFNSLEFWLEDYIPGFFFFLIFHSLVKILCSFIGNWSHRSNFKSTKYCRVSDLQNFWACWNNPSKNPGKRQIIKRLKLRNEF